MTSNASRRQLLALAAMAAPGLALAQTEGHRPNLAERAMGKADAKVTDLRPRPPRGVPRRGLTS